MIKTICNMCGKEFDFWDMQEDFHIEKDEIGYGSKHDGMHLKLDLCCSCMDSLIDRCIIPPIAEYTYYLDNN